MPKTKRTSTPSNDTRATSAALGKRKTETVGGDGEEARAKPATRKRLRSAAVPEAPPILGLPAEIWFDILVEAAAPGFGRSDVGTDPKAADPKAATPEATVVSFAGLRATCRFFRVVVNTPRFFVAHWERWFGGSVLELERLALLRARAEGRGNPQKRSAETKGGTGPYDLPHSRHETLLRNAVRDWTKRLGFEFPLFRTLPPQKVKRDMPVRTDHRHADLSWIVLSTEISSRGRVAPVLIGLERCDCCAPQKHVFYPGWMHVRSAAVQAVHRGHPTLLRRSLAAWDELTRGEPRHRRIFPIDFYYPPAGSKATNITKLAIEGMPCRFFEEFDEFLYSKDDGDDGFEAKYRAWRLALRGGRDDLVDAWLREGDVPAWWASRRHELIQLVVASRNPDLLTALHRHGAPITDLKADDRGVARPVVSTAASPDRGCLLYLAASRWERSMLERTLDLLGDPDDRGKRLLLCRAATRPNHHGRRCLDDFVGCLRVLVERGYAGIDADLCVDLICDFARGGALRRLQTFEIASDCGVDVMRLLAERGLAGVAVSDRAKAGLHATVGALSKTDAWIRLKCLVEILVDAGVDLWEGFDRGTSAVQTLARTSTGGAVLRLSVPLEKDDVVRIDGFGRTLLIEAAEGGSATATQYLLDFGADPAGEDGLNRPLLYAVKNRHGAVAVKLIERGADPFAFQLAEIHPPPLETRTKAWEATVDDALELARNYKRNPTPTNRALLEEMRRWE